MDVSLSELRELVMDREAWRAAIHAVTKSWTWLSNWTDLISCLKEVNIFVPQTLNIVAQRLNNHISNTFQDLQSIFFETTYLANFYHYFN